MVNNLVKVIVGSVVVIAAVYPFINKQSSQNQIIEDATNKVVVKPLLEPKAKVEKKALPDFAAIYDVKTKKRAFFDYLTPYVNEINHELLIQRQFILSLNEQPTSASAQAKFAAIAKKFRVKTDKDFKQIKQQLLTRVDALPIELVLMQAANESAWGTSRFALTANNLFGQWCFKPGCGVVPEGRPEGKTYEVRKFTHPVDSIRSYFHNLNTGYAYEDLREARNTLRNMEQSLDAMVLAEGLLSYSTRREAYVDEIQKMISVNRKYINIQVN